MENLKCNVRNCTFNHNMNCNAGAINIKGADALTTSETTCSSYVDRSANAFTNSVSNIKTTPNNISCEAYHCTYNKNMNCSASNVSIDVNKASCETFKYE